MWRVEFLGEEGLEDAGNEAFDSIEDFSLRHHALPFAAMGHRRVQRDCIWGWWLVRGIFFWRNYPRGKREGFAYIPQAISACVIRML